MQKEEERRRRKKKKGIDVKGFEPSPYEFEIFQWDHLGFLSALSSVAKASDKLNKLIIF